MNQELERERFEVWASTCDGNCNQHNLRRATGVIADEIDYADITVERDWLVWRARAELAQVPGWISVKDRLPEEDGHYLAATWRRMDGQQKIETVSFRSGASHWNTESITHWMPLPSPPTQDEK